MCCCRLSDGRWYRCGTAFSFTPTAVRRSEFLNKTLATAHEKHPRPFVFLDRIYIDCQCSDSGYDMVKAVLYILLKINSTKSFTTTIMKRHRVLYRREEETVYNIDYTWSYSGC